MSKLMTETRPLITTLKSSLKDPNRGVGLVVTGNYYSPRGESAGVRGNDIVGGVLTSCRVELKLQHRRMIGVTFKDCTFVLQTYNVLFHNCVFDGCVFLSRNIMHQTQFNECMFVGTTVFRTSPYTTVRYTDCYIEGLHGVWTDNRTMTLTNERIDVYRADINDKNRIRSVGLAFPYRGHYHSDGDELLILNVFGSWEEAYCVSKLVSTTASSKPRVQYYELLTSEDYSDILYKTKGE